LYDFFFFDNYNTNNKILSANSKPPKIKNKYAKPNKIFIFKKIEAFNIRQKSTKISNSLCKSRVIILFILIIKLQKINKIKLIKINSQSNTLFNSWV
jgi:hypothetical protein